MVYRGKPSAGCEQCRKAKKRCDLEQPSCSRCVKLHKQCTGYRDVSQLQIHDESETIKRKASRQNARQVVFASATSASTPHSDSTTYIDEVIELPLHDKDPFSNLNLFAQDAAPSNDAVDFESLQQLQSRVPISLTQSVDELACTYFFNQFTAPGGHWTWLRDMAVDLQLSPVLERGIRACGLASLDNVQPVTKGREYSRRLYAEALSLLNSALRDPQSSKSDSSLIAVTILSYYENLTCDGRESIMSWKAHVAGMTGMLKLRGSNQFKTPIGRMLFRETRAQILINCIWEDKSPPAFLYEWDRLLARATPNNEDHVLPADDLSFMCYDFATLRSKMISKTMDDTEAMDLANELETRMIQWSVNTLELPVWSYTCLEVAESPQVWNGLIHGYQRHPPAAVWNTWRGIRIMLTRTQTELYLALDPNADPECEQLKYYKSLRRQMADDICAAIPTNLGHAAPAYNSPNLLISAYNSVWPLFFAGTCALERLGANAWNQAMQPDRKFTTTSYAAAQAAWIIGRLQYISQHIGLRWADGVAAVLKSEFVDATSVTNLDQLAQDTVKAEDEQERWCRKLSLPGDQNPATWLLGQDTTAVEEDDSSWQGIGVKSDSATGHIKMARFEACLKQIP